MTGKERYQLYLKSPHWKKWSARRKKNSKKCCICFTKENLHVHHLRYKRWYDVKAKDLKVMCKYCHFLTHDLMKSGEIMFKFEHYAHKVAVIKRAIKKFNEQKLIDRKQS